MTYGYQLSRKSVPVPDSVTLRSRNVRLTVWISSERKRDFGRSNVTCPPNSPRKSEISEEAKALKRLPPNAESKLAGRWSHCRSKHR